MVITQRQRKLMLGVALSLTLLATYQVSQDESEPETATLAEPVATTDTKEIVAAQPLSLPEINLLLRLDQQPRYTNPSDLFSSRTWYVAPTQPRYVPPAVAYTPPAPVVSQPQFQLAPPTPSVPPLPFTYMGKVRYGDHKWQFFLTNGQTIHTVREGDIVDSIYKIGALLNGRLEITYLPLDIKQSLTIGERS